MKKVLSTLALFIVNCSLFIDGLPAVDCTNGCKVCERIMCVLTYISSSSGGSMGSAGGNSNYKYDCNNAFYIGWFSSGSGTQYSWKCNNGSPSGSSNCSSCYTQCVSGSTGVSSYPSPTADCNADTKTIVAGDANCPGGYFAVPGCAISARADSDDAGASGYICE